MDELWKKSLQTGEESGELPFILNNEGNSELPTRVSNTVSAITSAENPQDIIIADISYSTAQTVTSLENTTVVWLSSEQLKEMNLRSLLTEWNLASLTEELMCK